MMFTGLPVKFGSALSFWTAASAVTSPSLMTCDAWGVGRASQLNETWAGSVVRSWSGRDGPRRRLQAAHLERHRVVAVADRGADAVEDIHDLLGVDVRRHVREDVAPARRTKGVRDSQSLRLFASQRT